MVTVTKQIHGIPTATPNENAPKPVARNQPTVRERLASYFQWEALTVAGREVKGFIVSPTIAAILLTAFLGMAGWAYKSSTADSRETLIAITEMKTMLNERTHNFEREQDKMETKLDNEVKLAQMQREADAKKKTQLLLALRAKGITIDLE